MIMAQQRHFMRSFNSSHLRGIAVLLSALAIPAWGAKVEFQADITRGTCTVSVPETLNFGLTLVSDFQGPKSTADVRDLAVGLQCKDFGSKVLGQPSIKVTGTMEGDMFRDTSSTAKGVGFMLKSTSIADKTAFYSHAGTVRNGDLIPILDVNAQEQILSLGFVRGAGNISNGEAKATLKFEFAYP